MKRYLIFFLICIFISGMLPVDAAQTNTDIYVDAGAEVEGNGDIASPFRTLEAARDYIRSIKKSGSYPEGGITVNLRGGVYSRNGVFALGAEDGGTEGAPVIYKAYANEEVKIVGGTELKLKDFKVSDDAAIDSSAAGKVYSYNLKQNGVEGYKELYVSGHSAYYIQQLGFSKAGPNLPVPLYNEESCTLARYPNDGYLTVDSVIEPGDAVRHWYEGDRSADYVPESERNYPPKTMKIKVEDSRIEKWGNAKNMWANGYWFYDWSDQTTSIVNIDTKNKTIESGYPLAYAVQQGQRYYVFNLLEELDMPGEWYYDIDTGEFYIYPKDNNPESTVLLPFMEEALLEISDAKHLEIRGITFTGARLTAITVNNCENVEINYCTVSHVAGAGIMAEGGKNVTIRGCHLYDLGEQGIAVTGGNTETLEPANHLVTNNWIHDFATIFKTYMPGVRVNGVGNTVSHNLIHDAPHCAVLHGGNDNIIEYNEIHSVLKEAADMGAIYSGRSFIARGNIIRGNIIHDNYSDSEKNDTHAIYFDDSHSGVTVTGNIFYNLPLNGVFINGGRDHTVTNNIFVNIANSGFTMNCGGRAKNWNLEAGFEERLGLTKGLHLTEPYAKYPHLANIMEDSPMDAKYNVFKNNVSVNVGKEYDLRNLAEYGSPVTYDELKAMNDINEGFTAYDVEDVGFVAPEKGDYTLRPDSKVFEILPEFENIDAKNAGLITSRLANELGNDAVALVVGNPNTYVNWKRKLIDEENTSVVPFIENDYTYVPVRYMAEILGGSVSWENGIVTIDLSGAELKLEIGSKTAQIGGSETELNAAAIIREDRTFVPLRDCSSLFGKNVFWDDRGLIIVSGKNMEEKFTEGMIEDLINRLQ